VDAASIRAYRPCETSARRTTRALRDRLRLKLYAPGVLPELRHMTDPRVSEPLTDQSALHAVEIATLLLLEAQELDY